MVLTKWFSLEARQQLQICCHFAQIRQEGMGITIFLILLSAKQCQSGTFLHHSLVGDNECVFLSRWIGAGMEQLGSG